VAGSAFHPEDRVVVSVTWFPRPFVILSLGMLVPSFRPVPAAAQTPPSLGDLVSRALRNNPDIRLASVRTDSARAEGRIARAIPNPTLAAIPNAPYQYQASLPLDVGPQRLLRTRAAGNGSVAAQLDLADVTRQVVLQVRRAYYDLLLAEAEREVAGTQRDIFRQVLAADSVRVRIGDAPARNLVKSEIELARAEGDLNQAAAAVREAGLNLQALIGVTAPDTGFAVAGVLAYRPIPAFDALVQATGQDRPDLLAAQRREQQARALRGLAAATILPVPALSVTYQPRGGFDRTEWWTVGASGRFSLGLGLQIPLFYQNGGERARATAGVEAASVAEGRTRLGVQTDIAIAADQYRAAAARVARYEGGLVARSDTALAQARYAYRAGAASLLDLLDAIRTSGEIRLAGARAIHDYWVSGYALAAAAGQDVLPQ
jgi:cobalt-zinc-cadmium efflux system outer membrane protein